jgi:DNA-binding MarR family transcriptional regulator
MSESKRAPAQFLTDAAVRRGVDLIFVGYRQYLNSVDDELTKAGLGQAHHRAIYFINRVEAVSPKALGEYLGITKQALVRIMVGLKRGGYVEETANTRDGRVKHLYLTDKGLELEQRLYEGAKERIKKAYSEAGANAVQGFWDVLSGLAGADTTSSYAKLLAHHKA